MSSSAVLDHSARRVLWPYAVAIAAAGIVPFVFIPSLLTRAASSDFLPHRYCYLNTPGLVWANVVSDTAIGVAYIAISATLAYLVHRTRRDIPFSWMFLAFGLFIVACGGTHIMEVVTVWRPYYWLSADIKIVTGLASLATAFSLPALVPKTLNLLTAQQVAAERKSQLEVANVRMLEMERLSVQLASQAASGIAFWEYDIAKKQIHWWGDVQRVFGREFKTGTLAEFLEVVHPEDRKRIMRDVDTAVSSGTEYDSEFRVQTAEGLRWCIGRGRPTIKDGVAVALVGVNMDETARRQTDLALRQSEKLAITGRLAATIAHEINNPLGAVTNLNWLVQHDPTASESVLKTSAIMQEELQRITHIVRHTLGFNRDSAAEGPVELRTIVESSLVLYDAELRKKAIVVDKHLSDGVLVHGRSGDLRQVAANLIKNAIDAVPRGGKLRIRTYSRGNSSCIAVVDNGSGIPFEARPKLFQPFFTTKGEEGTGIGLWVSAEIVRQAGGVLKFRSISSPQLHGTAFVVCLPAMRRTR